MKRIYIIIGIIFLTLSSCSKFLDIKPYGKTIPKTPEEFSALLNKAMDELDYGESIIMGDYNSPSRLECYSDNLEASLTQYPQGTNLPLYIGDQLSAKQREYEKYYEAIRTANIVIGYLKDNGTQQAKDALGTAYAIRGVCYYELLRRFSEPYESGTSDLGVPLVLEFNMEEKPIRSTKEETYRQIEEDFEKALSYNIQDENYRFDSDVIKGYLARLYFWTQKYDKAIKLSKELLVKYPMLSQQNYREMIESQQAIKGNTLIKSGIFTNSSIQMNLLNFTNYLQARPVSKRFVDLFIEKDRDIRYELSFDKKRKVKKNPLVLMRSAEFAFILAESYYHIGNKTEALEVLNQIRDHRIENNVHYTMNSLPAIGTDGYIKQDAKGNPLTPLLYSILAERQKEFFMEGDRWFELKRNGRPEFWSAKQGLKFTTLKFMYTYPLPITDLLLVDGLKQNEGYNQTK